MNANSSPFEVSIVAPGSTLSLPGDAVLLNPALVLGSGVRIENQLLTKDGTWTAGPGRAALLNGVDTHQPYSDSEVMFINNGGALWVRSPGHGYACWNSTAKTWSWANCAGAGGSAPL